MTTRADIEQVIADYADVPRDDLPEWLRIPRNKHEFALSIGLLTHQLPDGTLPVYDHDDRLVGWSRGGATRAN